MHHQISILYTFRVLFRSYPGYVVVGLALFSCAGWGLAWKNSRKPRSERITAVEHRSSNSPTRDARETTVASLIQNPRSARLLNEITDIAAAARHGSINEKLIAACRATLLDGDADSRGRDFSLLMEQLRPEDAASMHETFLALHREGKAFGPEYACFAARWGEVDGEGALRYIYGQIPKVVPSFDFRNIARGWAEKDPHAALAWMDAHAEDAEGMLGRPAIVERWMRNDPDAATAWLLSQKNLSPEETSECVGWSMLEQLHGKDLTQAVRWLADLPDDGNFAAASSEGWERALPELRELTYEQAANVWSEIGDQPWMTLDQFTSFMGVVSESRTATAGETGFLDQLSHSWPAEKISNRFATWAASEPDATADWIEDIPPSPVRNAAIAGLIRTLQSSDPPAAQKWQAVLAGQ